MLHDLTAGRRGAPPLWLADDGTFRDDPSAAEPPSGLAALTALVRAARWISTRRTITFERLFPGSPFRPDEPARAERLTEPMARGLLAQLRGALDAGAGPDHVQLRSAIVTVLSHLVASAGRAPELRPHAEVAAGWILELIEHETGPDASRALWAHAVHLLQLRAPHLDASARARVTTLVRGLVRAAPPYAELGGTWRFAMCSAHDFHHGECEVLRTKYGFIEVQRAPVEGMPERRYTVLEAPYTATTGARIEVWARGANPSDENDEMGASAFVGLLINRHAQLGAFDMRASLTGVTQRGYKLMMNGQCAGLTTRFAISRLFPDADIYSSWDSTYFRTGPDGEVSASEAIDCFAAILRGFSAVESHSSLSERARAVQWHHKQQGTPGFVQFVGPSHPLVVARYSDVNHDGKADYYDGFLDFDLHAIAEDVRAGMTPRDPGIAPSQVGGEAARGLGWAAGSLNRVTQYSDLWDALPGSAENLYAFAAGGFYSHVEPPADAPARRLMDDPGRQPALCRYTMAQGLSAEVMYHAWLAHAPMELKRLLVAADAVWAAVDAGHLRGEPALVSPSGQRAMVLLTLAGLLEFPVEQNYVDALWSEALRALGFPEISRSTVRSCITDVDHGAGHYYGSRRGIQQLTGAGAGSLAAADPVAAQLWTDADPTVGRARPLSL